MNNWKILSFARKYTLRVNIYNARMLIIKKYEYYDVSRVYEAMPFWYLAQFTALKKLSIL